MNRDKANSKMTTKEIELLQGKIYRELKFSNRFLDTQKARRKEAHYNTTSTEESESNSSEKRCAQTDVKESNKFKEIGEFKPKFALVIFAIADLFIDLKNLSGRQKLDFKKMAMDFSLKFKGKKFKLFQ